MKINTEEFRKICNIIVTATSGSGMASFANTLELVARDNTLYLNVTNREYYVSVKFDLAEETDFHAVVNADLFLKLVSATTSEEIELKIKDTYVQMKANGSYKIPLIFTNDHLAAVPTISIDNINTEMNIPGDILNNIATENTCYKDLFKGTLINGKNLSPITKMFYFDQHGCITFFKDACVNNFELEKPIKLLFDNKLVSLFKLFKGADVSFALGHDPVSETIIQTKVTFVSDKIKLVAIISCDDALLNSVPEKIIRAKANKTYPYSIAINKKAFAEAISRLLLFGEDLKKQQINQFSLFEIDDKCVTIHDPKKENTEVVKYEGNPITEPWSMTLDLLTLQRILNNCSEQYLTWNFGDDEACAIVRNNITNVIPLVSKK